MFYRQYQLIGNQPTIVVTPVVRPTRLPVHPEHTGHHITTTPTVPETPVKRVNPFSLVPKTD